jgi:hypothetical protein
MELDSLTLLVVRSLHGGNVHAALNSSVKMDWQTPDSLLELVRKVGPIALDPCTVSDNPTQARAICTPANDGLQVEWSRVTRTWPGLVYVNPPYGRELHKWIAKCVVEGRDGAEIVLLTPARTDTNWTHMAATSAQVTLFWKGRLKFKGAKDAAPFPSALFYWGPRHERFREVFAGRGLFL